MNSYSVLLWLCILTFVVLPWLLATVFAWVYAEGYEKQASEMEGDMTRLGYISAILQTSSSIVYIVFIFGTLVCIGIVGRPQDHCSYLCLVLGIPIFFVVPITSGILVLISALDKEASIDRNIGITATVLYFISTLPCCCILFCALACGTRGKGRRSRYPLPFAYIPVLGEWEQREDKWEVKKNRRDFTDEYPSDAPPGPLPSYKAERSKFRTAKNSNANSQTSSNSVPYSRDIGQKGSKLLESVSSGAHRKLSAGSLSTIREDSDQTVPEDHQNVSDNIFKHDKDKSQRKFSLTSFLNSRRNSSSTSLETQERKSTDHPNRRHSEPASKVEASKGKGQTTTTTFSTAKPNLRKADSAVKEVDCSQSKFSRR